MLTINPVIVFTAGVVSMSVTFTELLPQRRPADNPSFNGPGQAAGKAGAAIHCGSVMDLVTPAVGPSGVGYTFEPEDSGPVELPPVWRCGCGFQLDAWIRSPYAHFQDETPAPKTPHFTALAA